MAVGRLIFMVVFTPLTSYASPFSLLFKTLFYKKIWVVGIQVEKYPYRLCTISALVCYLKDFVLMKISMTYQHT